MIRFFVLMPFLALPLCAKEATALDAVTGRAARLRGQDSPRLSGGCRSALA